MKYNEKYNRWFTKGGLVYRYNLKQDKLVLCKQTNIKGYRKFHDFNNKAIFVHRAIYETFVGNIPQNYQIDHINTIKNDNRLENLRCVTPKENSNNPLTRKLKSKIQIGKTKSEFGKKFKEYYGVTNYENPKLYHREQVWYHRHNNKCRWEE